MSKQKDKEAIIYRMGMRDTLDFLSDECAIEPGIVAWLVENWMIKNKEDLEHYKDFNKLYEK